MEGWLEVLEDGTPVAVTRAMALVNDHHVEVVRGVLLEESTSRREGCIKTLVYAEVEVVIQGNLPSSDHRSRLAEGCELVIRLVAQVHSARQEQNLFCVAGLEQL